MRFFSFLLVFVYSFAWAAPSEVACVQLGDSDWDKLFSLLAKDSGSSFAWRRLNEKVKASLNACKDRLEEPRYQGCLDNLDAFVSNQWQTRQPGHSMQFLWSDADYLKAQPKEMISLPLVLQDGLPENWREVCEELSFDCVEFVSKSLPNPPDLSFRRLLIVETTETFDRWMLFTMPSDGEGTAERLIDFLGVEKAQRDPQTGELLPLEEARLHFVEYWRDRDGKNPVYRKNIASCYKCHPSGMRDIVPAYGSVSEAEMELVKELNQRMHSYPPFNWGPGTIDIASYGPPMGEGTCTKCHYGQDRGVLNAGHLGERSRHQIYFKMAQDLAMPPRSIPAKQSLEKAAVLSTKERALLYDPSSVWVLSDMFRVSLGGSKGPMAASNEEVLRALSEKDIISKDEYNEALQSIQREQDEATLAYQKMMQDYQKDLRRWLRGGREECEELFEEE